MRIFTRAVQGCCLLVLLGFILIVLLIPGLLGQLIDLFVSGTYK